MSPEGRGRPAVVAAIAAVLLWQLTAEVRYQLRFWQVTSVDVIPIAGVLAQGSPFSFRMLLRGWSTPVFLGILVSNAVVLVVVWLLVRAITRRRVAARGVVFLASWMAVLIAAVAAALATAPFYSAAMGFPDDAAEYAVSIIVQYVTIAPYSGFVLGWIPALLAALMTPPSAAQLAPPQATGYPPPIGHPTPTGQPPSDPNASPYLTERPYPEQR